MVSLVHMARGVREALLWGIIAATVVAVILNRLHEYTVFPPPGVARLPELVAALRTSAPLATSASPCSLAWACSPW